MFFDHPTSPIPVALLLTDELFTVRDIILKALVFYERNEYFDCAQMCLAALPPLNAMIARRVYESGNCQRNWVAEPRL